LAQYELIGGGWRNSVEFLEKLMAVTPADIQRVSQKYMRNIRFVVLGNPRSVDTNVFTGQLASEISDLKSEISHRSRAGSVRTSYDRGVGEYALPRRPC
jgi:hypothetical protein